MPGALRHRDYRVFWLGSMVQGVGQWMQTFAVGWWLAELAVREGDPQRASLYLGLLGFATAVPTFVLTPFAGALSDRKDQRAMIFVSQVGATLCSALLAALAVLGADVLSVMLVIGALSAIRAFDIPIRWSLVGRIVPTRDRVSAIGLQSVSFNVPQILGPAAGGLLIGTLGVDGLLLAAAVSGAGLIAALLMMAPVPPLPRERMVSVLTDMREGVSFIVRDPVLRPASLICIAVASLARPATFLLPAFAVTVLHVGALELSWLVSATGIGGSIGALATANLGGLKQRGVAFLLVAVAAGLLVSALGIQVQLPAALATTFLFGLAAMLFAGMSNTLFQMLSPDVMRGRVMSLYTMIFMGFIPLGTMALGTLGSVTGVDRAFVLAGGAVAVMAAYTWLRPGIRNVRTRALEHEVAVAQA